MSSMADAPRFITAERWAEIVATADIPEALRDALAGKVEPDGLVHWHGADQQEVVFFGVHRPSRCGRFAPDTTGYPLRHVTCPKCRGLAEADGVLAMAPPANFPGADHVPFVDLGDGPIRRGQ